MESVDEFKKELLEHVTAWVDERLDEAVKAAVAEANKDLTFYIDLHFGKVETDLNNVAGVVDSMAKDVGTMVDTVAKNIVDQLGKLNPFHL